MKKIVALMMTLALVLSFTASLAETRMFMAISATNDAGETTTALDNENFPTLYLTIDDVAMTCEFSDDTEENVITGTMEITETGENYVLLHAVMADGSEAEIEYTASDDSIVAIDSASGVAFSMIRIDNLLDEAE